MRIHKMLISVVADNGCPPVAISYYSPKKIVQGIRLKIGWAFITIGAKILYGKIWECR